MSPEEKRLKEIKYRRFEILQELKALKKELLALRAEEEMINGYSHLEYDNVKKKVRTRKK